MRAKKAPVQTAPPGVQPRGSGRLCRRLLPAPPGQVTVLGEGPGAAPAVIEVLRRAGVLA
jgi:electron transfer flavoprotein beta subunit